MRPTRTIIVLLAALALALAACGDDDARDGGSPTTTAPASAPQRPVVGIGEQHAAMFSDPRFAALGIDTARLVAAYDATRVRFERDLVDLWLAAARRAGVEPFVTFGHSRVDPEKLPSVTEFRSAFRAFRRRYPDVRVYAPWNEINHVSQPTADAPRRAAEYYNVVRAECADCIVLAGDVLDQAGMTDYLDEYRRHLDGEPAIWGLHNYADANRFRSTGLRRMLGAVRGEIWLTETGGIVKFGRGFPRDEQRAARAVAHALELARKHERVTRVYLYNWTGSKPEDRFDAGLIGPDGAARPALDVLRAALRR
ncbi:MAG TPA: hypothetical protein VG474_09000 [Solirubrobacteraceae bacterium]|nr:hypothetical protein [Solirubrobacteraceae bacterium]